MAHNLFNYIFLCHDKNDNEHFSRVLGEAEEKNMKQAASKVKPYIKCRIYARNVKMKRKNEKRKTVHHP